MTIFLILAPFGSFALLMLVTSPEISLFTSAAICLAVIGIVAGIRLWPDAERVVSGFGKSPLMAVLSVKLLFLVTVAAHQIVHGLALVHYGRRVREFGFTFLHGFVPTFYVDVTDIFMGTRRARVVTARLDRQLGVLDRKVGSEVREPTLRIGGASGAGAVPVELVAGRPGRAVDPAGA